MKKLLLISLLAACTTRAFVKQVDDSSFNKEVIRADRPVVIKLFTPMCGSCQEMKSIFAQLSNQFFQYKFVDIDVKDSSWVRNNLSINLVPTFLFFKNGKEVHRVIGSMSKEELRGLVEKYLG